jgi:hypothetical protein
MAADTSITLQLLFPDEKSIAALDLSSLIFDLNKIYVLALSFPEGEYGSIREFRDYERSSYRLSQDSRLDVGRIRFESPGIIDLTTVAAGGASAIWFLVQTLEKLRSWPLNREKLRLEVLKLEREIGRTSQRIRPARIEPFLSWPEVRSAIKHLEMNSLKASEIGVTLGSAINRD